MKKEILFNIFLCWIFQWTNVSGQFNLYDRDGSWVIHPYDGPCLFVGLGYVFQTTATLMPYCFRPIHQQTKEIDEETHCFGKMFSFQQLKSMNVTVSDLFSWNGAMKSIEAYSKYLAYPRKLDDNVRYCKCSSRFQFGEYCQYEIDPISAMSNDEWKFSHFLEAGLSIRYSQTLHDMKMEYMACYVGIPCQHSSICLDWRQICNGMVDCDHGDDEPIELCSQMDLNSCKPEKEFRCHNGLCIPIDAWNDGVLDCPDRSDERSYMVVLSETREACFSVDESLCAETMCRWKEYPCGDGQCLSYANAGSYSNDRMKTCASKRNLLLLKNIFSPNSIDNDRCWTAMICLIGFSHLYANINCPNEDIILKIEESCPDEFFFPSNPVIYSFVYFLYVKTHRTDWSSYTGPDYICYRNDSCQNLTLDPITVSKNNLTCIPMNEKLFSWANYYDYILYLFSSCYPSLKTLNSTIEEKMLFKCNLSNTTISVHHVNDKRIDCFFGEDENPMIDFCSFDLEDTFVCLVNTSQCIRQSFLQDNQNDCSDGSDETYLHSFISCPGKTCVHRFQKTLQMAHFYVFADLCDGLVNHYLFSQESNETDETDCRFWPYKCHSSPFTQCNGVWNCPNGIDELNCQTNTITTEIDKAFGCSKNEQYCIQLDRNRMDIKRTCLPFTQLGDGIIDCLGATDERFANPCTAKYPLDHQRRFLCMNSTLCITPAQVCDFIIDCPLEDDEAVCPWLYYTNATHFYCNNSLSHVLSRCPKTKAESASCQHRESSWFCDLSLRHPQRNRFYVQNVDVYPKVDLTPMTISNSDPKTASSVRPIRSMTLIDHRFSECNHGHPIRSTDSSTTRYVCLCPSTYYGEYCQYQAERLAVHLKVKESYYIHPSVIFRFVIYLLNERDAIIGYDEIMFHRGPESISRFLVYFLYERLTNVSLYQRMKAKRVRIDSYITRQTEVQYISSWLFDVMFPFRPMNIMTVSINVEDELFTIETCKKKCGRYGKCMYYLNDKSIKYCWCQPGWYGEECHLKLPSDLCHSTACAPHARCVVIDEQRKRIQCICPLGSSGDQCYITHHVCATSNLCQNNGTCLPLDQRKFDFVCICPNDYEGVNCERRRKTLNIAMDKNISDTGHVPAAVVILTSPAKNILSQQRRLFRDIQLPTNIKAYGNSKFALIQLYYNRSTTSYYMIAVQERPYSLLNTSVMPFHRCKSVRELFNTTVLHDYSYLKRLKLYHLPCRVNQSLKCFFDEYRMCFCTRDYRSNCFIFDHELNSCDHCQDRGLCVQENALENLWQFICLCESCSFGSLCQFSTANYYVTLDILIGINIRKGINSIGEQPRIFLSTLIVLTVIVASSSILNMLNLMILWKKDIRKVGCDFYLLSLLIISEIGLISLFLRFLFMLIVQMYDIEDIILMKISCYSLEYFVRLFPTLFDWLIACISIERAYIVIKDVRFTPTIAQKTLKLARWIVFGIVCVNILTTMHRFFNFRLVGEPAIRGGHMRHPWCILQFDSYSWNMYEKFTNIFHLVVPFSLNLVSMIFFLLFKTKIEMGSTIKREKNSFAVSLKQQLAKYKNLLISTTVILILEFPRLVSTFVYGCIINEWNRYAYFVVYLISYLPMTFIFFIYILPSPKYKTRLHEILRKYSSFYKSSSTRS